jgi:hypothetical protein
MRFDITLKAIKNKILDDEVSNLDSITRIHGTDILLAGSDKYIYAFNTKVKGKHDIVTLAKFENPCAPSPVTSIRFHTNKIFCYCSEQSLFFSIKFDKNIDFHQTFMVEFLSMKKEQSRLELAAIKKGKDEEESKFLKRRLKKIQQRSSKASGDGDSAKSQKYNSIDLKSDNGLKNVSKEADEANFRSESKISQNNS